MANLVEHFSPAQLYRAKQMAERSIGKKIRVRVDDKFTQIGVIDACEPSYAGFKGRSVYVVFSVDVLCGELKSRKNFKLTTLPQ